MNLSEEISSHIEKDILSAEEELDDDSESIIINERYLYIEDVVKKCFVKKNKGALTISDKIDRVVTNRILALPIFAVIMFIVYYISVTTVGTWVTDWTNDGLFGDGFHLFNIGVGEFEEATDAYASENIFTEEVLNLTQAATDSRQDFSMEEFFPNENSTLFLSIPDVLGVKWNETIWNNRSLTEKVSIYEKKFKDSAMAFLTDGQPKLFKSSQEGIMLVMLTNISFTPNKQLGRKVVDFSATVTELDEVNEENLIRYGIKHNFEYYTYVLEVLNRNSLNTVNLNYYISDNKILNKSGQNYLRLVEKKVRL
jgi:hypothetical protein